MAELRKDGPLSVKELSDRVGLLTDAGQQTLMNAFTAQQSRGGAKLFWELFEPELWSYAHQDRLRGIVSLPVAAPPPAVAPAPTRRITGKQKPSALTSGQLRDHLRPFVAEVLARLPNRGNIPLRDVQGFLNNNPRFGDATVGLDPQGITRRFLELYPETFTIDGDRQVGRTIGR